MRALAGTGTLTSLALRRDRIMLAAWIYVLTAWVVGTAYSLKKLYPTAAAQQRFAATVAHSALFDALYDPLFGSSLGALTAWRISSPTALLAGLMSVFIVVRHTRADEEAGRLELVSAASVGRQAALASALLVAFGASIVFAALAAAGLIFLGLPAAGALTLGLAIASAGWVFAAVAAIAAQVAETARVARGIAIAVVAAAYVLRDISSGTAGASWLMWLSPIGWAVQVQPYGGERLWVLGLAVGTAAIAVAVAFGLSARRDLGAGLVPSRPGPRRAAAWLRDPFALAWRLQRGGLIGWTAGVAATGAIIGILTPSVGTLIGTSSGMQNAFTKLGGSSAITEAFLAAMFAFYGLVAAAYAVAATCGCARKRRASGPSRCSRPRLAGSAGPRATCWSRRPARPCCWPPPGLPRVSPTRRAPGTPGRCRGSWEPPWRNCRPGGCLPGSRSHCSGSSPGSMPPRGRRSWYSCCSASSVRCCCCPSGSWTSHRSPMCPSCLARRSRSRRSSG